MSALPNTIAGRLQMLQELYMQEVYDSEGNLIGYEETGIITKEQMLALLMDLDNVEQKS